MKKNIEIIKENRHKYYDDMPHYSSCNFVRTYYVEMLREMEDEDTTAVVLSEFQSDKLTTITLSNALAKDLEVGSSYEFTFKTYQAYIDTDIENVFDENEVVSVKKTDKTGVQQIQEDGCSIFY